MTSAASPRNSLVMIAVPFAISISATNPASLGGSPAVNLKGAGLDPRYQLATELDRIVQGVEAANEEGIHAKHVVFEERLRDLLGSADKARRVAECAGGPCNRHPQALVMNVALAREAHQPLSGIIDRTLCFLLPAPSFLAAHAR